MNKRKNWTRIWMSFVHLLIVCACMSWGGTEGHANQKALRQKALQSLQNITTLEARFLEKGARGERKGTVFLKRPNECSEYGKLKFLYDDGALEVVSLSGIVYIWHKKSHTVENTPLSSTPLFVFMRSEIRLGDAVEEKELKKEDGHIYWTLAQTDQTGAESPQVTLVFDEKTVALEGWIITDATGTETEVILSSTRLGHHIHNSFFQKPEEEN